MAKLYKATIYITDYNDEIRDLDYLESLIESKLDRWVGVNITETQESDEFEWDDDLLINKTNAELDDFEVYFK